MIDSYSSANGRICIQNSDNFLFTDEAQFTCDGLNMCNSHLLLAVKPHKMIE
jgi:hypothetical protein